MLTTMILIMLPYINGDVHMFLFTLRVFEAGGSCPMML